MSDYKNEVRTAGYSVNKGIYGKGKYAMPPKIKKNFSRTTSIRTDYYPDSLNDRRELGGSATFNLHRNDTRFITYQREIISTNVNQYVGIYTLIIDKNTNQAKEIAEYRDPTMPKETAHIKDVKFKTSHDDFNGIDTTTIDYDSKLLGHHETLTHKQELY